MNTKKKIVIFFTIILILLSIGVFFFKTSEFKEKKITLTKAETIWLKNNRDKVFPILISENDSVYLYKNSQGKFEGVYYDYIQWMKKEYNLNLEIVQKNNTIFTEEVNNGTPIIVYNASKNLEREANYNYIDLKAETSIVVVKKYGTSLNKEKKIKNIGMIKNSSETQKYFSTFTSNKYIKIIVSDYEEGLEKLKNGEIDLFLGKSRNFLYTQVETEIVEKLSTLNYTLAINKKYPELYNILQNTIPIFEENEFHESYLKYTRVYSLTKLENNPILKEVKKKYNKIVVDVLYETDFLPLYYIKDGKMHGYLPTLMNNISSSIGIPIEFETNQSTSVKHLHAIDPTNTNPLKIPFYKIKAVAIGKKGNKYVQSIDDLEGKKIGIILDNYTKNVSLDRNLNFVIFDNTKVAIEALKKNKIDYIVGDFIFLDSKIENLYLKDEIKVLGFLEELNHTLSFTFTEENRILYNLFLQILPKDVSEYVNLKELLVSPKVININYYYIASIIFGFSAIIIVILFFLKINIKYKNRAENLNRAMISSFEMASSYNDEDTGEHITRVAKYSELMGKNLNLPSSVVKDISYYASLHDIGKIGISDSILKKPGKLSIEEIDEMRKHSTIGYELVKNAGLGKTAENLVRFHHERWDGKGYPLGLKGEEIPIEARIVSLADVYDALRQKRAYKEAFTHKKAMEIIVADSGVFFDPKLVELFVKLNKEFENIFNKY